MLEGKIRKTLVGLAAAASLACGSAKGGCDDCSSGYTPPAQGSGYFEEAVYGDNADAEGCRDGCYKENPNEKCCWCPD